MVFFSFFPSSQETPIETDFPFPFLILAGSHVPYSICSYGRGIHFIAHFARIGLTALKTRPFLFLFFPSLFRFALCYYKSVLLSLNPLGSLQARSKNIPRERRESERETLRFSKHFVLPLFHSSLTHAHRSGFTGRKKNPHLLYNNHTLGRELKILRKPNYLLCSLHCTSERTRALPTKVLQLKKYL